jgi:hypothetical protein
MTFQECHPVVSDAVSLVRADVSEKYIASIISVEKISEQSAEIVASYC